MRLVSFPIALLLVSSPAQALEFFSVPGSFGTIQEALDASSSGDTILVEPGTYPEQLDFLGKDVELIGLGGPELNILDAGQAGAAVRFVNGEGSAALLQGFTITGGLRIGSNLPGGAGGGVLCRGSSPTLRDNVVEGNRATWGAGIACLGGAEPELSDNVVRNNIAGQDGGGLFIRASSPRVMENTFLENEAGLDGGGVYVDAVFSDPLMTGNDVIGNQALSRGGGIAVENGLVTQTALVGNRILDNQALFGGGLFLSSSAPRVRNNTIQNNQATVRGGGVVLSQVRLFIKLRGNMITGNQAGESGGGLWVTGLSVCDLESTTVAGNAAGSGGGALDVATSQVHGLDLIFAHNQAPEAREIRLSGSSLFLQDSCLFGGLGATQINASSDLQLSGTVVTEDPLFADSRANDWRLAFGSPCIDRGSSSQTQGDLLGTVRPVDGDLDLEPAPDMGALEFAPLFLVQPATVGGSLILELWGSSGAFSELWLAFAPVVDGTDTPFGSFRLATGAFPVGELPTGSPFVLQRSVRSSAPIIGQTLSFQALTDSVAAPAGRAWSNPISFFVEP